MTYSLSICMPVYNCGAYVGQALDSILPQAGDDVEVVVYDGGSTDNTPRVIEPRLAAFPHLRYHRGSARGGIDADMATCVAHASGAYCWLFSGDDVMRPGAIERARESTRSGHDVYICRHTVCDIEMNVLRDYPVLAPDGAFTAEWSHPVARRAWFSRAANSEAFFSFMSGLLINRKRWLDGRLIPEFDGSCWAHVARLFELADAGLRVAYIPEVWLDRRGDNDSFREHGIVDRVRLAIDGFNRLGDRFFSHDSVEAFHIRRVLRNEFNFRGFLLLKAMSSRSASKSERKVLDRIVAATYVDRSLENTARRAVYRLAPPWSIRAAVKLRRLAQGR